jgi:hypothetical protein
MTMFCQGDRATSTRIRSNRPRPREQACSGLHIRDIAQSQTRPAHSGHRTLTATSALLVDEAVGFSEGGDVRWTMGGSQRTPKRYHVLVRIVIVASI